jgi:hypothetical protein
MAANFNIFSYFFILIVSNFEFWLRRFIIKMQKEGKTLHLLYKTSQKITKCLGFPKKSCMG